MRVPLHRSLVLVLLAGLCIAPAVAQDYPRKPIRLIVGYSPGGGASNGANVIAPKLGETLGQPVIVEHRPGANSAIAVDLVAKSPPDGYTLLAGASSMTTFPASKRKFDFDVRRDFALVSQLYASGFLMVAHPSVPANNMRELLEYGRANPGKLNYGAINSGADYLAFEFFKSLTGLDMVNVPYKGTADIDRGMLAGEIHLALTSGGALPHVKAGKMKILAVTGAHRNPALPDIPTAGETIKGFDAGFFVGVLAPAKTPPEIVRKLNQAITRVLNDPQVKERYAQLQYVATPGTPADFEKTFFGEVNRWVDLVNSRKLNFE